MTWPTLTDAQISEITRRTYRRYRRPFGKSIASTVATRRADRLRAQRFAAGLSDVEIENEVTLRVATLLEFGATVEGAWAAGEKYRDELTKEAGR